MTWTGRSTVNEVVSLDVVQALLLVVTQFNRVDGRAGKRRCGAVTRFNNVDGHAGVCRVAWSHGLSGV